MALSSVKATRIFQVSDMLQENGTLQNLKCSTAELSSSCSLVVSFGKMISWVYCNFASSYLLQVPPELGPAREKSHSVPVRLSFIKSPARAG